MKRLFIRIAFLCVALGPGTVAFALPLGEFVRVVTNQTFTGACCFTWGETVVVTEPKGLVPVVVTWSTDYRTTTSGTYHVGVAINGHPCLSDTIAQSAPLDGTFNSRTFQFIVLPSDGLLKGHNNITLCGGTAGGSITLGFNTLAARIAK